MHRKLWLVKIIQLYIFVVEELIIISDSIMHVHSANDFAFKKFQTYSLKLWAHIQKCICLSMMTWKHGNAFAFLALCGWGGGTGVHRWIPIMRSFDVSFMVARINSIDPSQENDHSQSSEAVLFHDDVIKWKHFPRYWPFVLFTLAAGGFPSQRPVKRFD